MNVAPEIFPPFRGERNIIEAAAAGASLSIKQIANIAVNLIAFIALLELLNSLLAWLGDRVAWNDPQLSFEVGNVIRNRSNNIAFCASMFVT